MSDEQHKLHHEMMNRSLSLSDDQDDEITLISCMRCGSNMMMGMGPEKATCPSCKKRSLTPTQHVVSKARFQRTTQQTALYLDGARELASKLEKLNTIVANLLAKQVRKLEGKFLSWEGTPPTPDAKTIVVNELIKLSTQAFSLLSIKTVVNRKE